MRGSLFGFAIVLFAATPAAAVIQYGGQSRQVATLTGPGGSPAGTSDLENTAATGLWTATAASIYSDGGGDATASASQTSNLGDFEISMSGALMGAGAGNTPPFGGYIGVGQSSLSATFTLDVDSRYVSTLLATTANVMNFIFADAATNYAANSSGILPGGRQYSLLLFFQEGNSGVGPGSESCEYAYNLTIVPEPTSVCLILAGAGLVTAAARRKPRPLS